MDASLHRPRVLPVALALALGSTAAFAAPQELRVFELNAQSVQDVHWTADSNLGPMGAFLQSYSFDGDVVVDFDQNPNGGIARITDARLIVPNTVVAVLLTGPNPGTVAFFDLELGATSPDFTILPTFPAPTFQATLDLVVMSGTMRVEPPFGPALETSLAGTSLGSIPVSGAFPSTGPAQGMTLGTFSFDMTFNASGWNGTFTHQANGLSAIGGCPSPSSYCPSDPSVAGGGTTLELVGSTSVAADDFTLLVSRAPQNTFGVYFHGRRRGSLPSGFGNVCVGGPLERLGVVATGPNGTTSLRVILANHQTGPLALEPGAHGHFQFYHRVVTPTQSSWNYSNALAVTFCP